MKMAALLGAIWLVGVLFHVGQSHGVVHSFKSEDQTDGQTMEQKVYLPHCTGSWYVDSQGTDDTMDSVDWAVLKCTDYSEESAR